MYTQIMDIIPYEIVYNIFRYIDIVTLKACHCVSKSFQEYSIVHRKHALNVFLNYTYYHIIKLKHPHHPLTVLLLTYLYNPHNLHIPFYARYTDFALDIGMLIDMKKHSVLDIYRDYNIPRPTEKCCFDYRKKKE